MTSYDILWYLISYLMTLKIDAKFEEKLICCFKNDKNLVKFNASTWKSPKIALSFAACAKYLIFDLKKYRRVVFHETEEGYKIWRGIDLSFENWHKEFDTFWPEHSKVSKNFTLMGSFWAKYILFDLKRYRGVIFHDIEEWCKIWRKTDLSFGKWHEEFGKFSPEHSKVSKSELCLMGSFCPK